MKLYHSRGSRSSRVLWLLDELGLDYEIETMPFDPESMKSVDYLAVDPFGKVPVLVDDALIMYESVAIVQYLLEHYADGRLEPDRRSPEYGRFLQWMQFGETTLMGPVSQIADHTKLLPEAERDAGMARQAKRTFDHYAGILDEALQGQDYLLDDEFTAADIVVGYSLHVANTCDALPSKLTALAAYYERLAARPSFQKAVA